MSIKVGEYSFDGPYANTNALEERSGIYAIHCYRNNAYYLIDVGESSAIKTRVESHDRKACWNKNCAGTLTVSVYYTPNTQEADRREIEQKIRNQYRPPCGTI